jgi:hypothetical protein
MATINKTFDWCKSYGIDTVSVIVNPIRQTLTIIDSYKITKSKHIKEVLNWLKTDEISENILTQPLSILVAEWKTHNLLYFLNIEVNRTKHVDMSKNMKTIEKIGYVFVSLFYWN